MNYISRIFTDSITQGLRQASPKHELSQEVVTALRENVFVFSGMKTYQELKEASLLLLTAKEEIKPLKEFKEEVQAIHKNYNERYLEAEYDFAVHSSLMAAKWQDFEAEGQEYDLQYRTAGDNRVRPEHAALNGITLPKEDPFWGEYYPPNGWECRCTAVQVRRGKYPLSNPAEAGELGKAATTQKGKDGVNKAAMFRFNPGKTLKIFPNKHPYFARESSPQDVKQAQQIVRQMAGKIETWREIETKKGKVRVSSLHGEKESKENTGIASFLANRHAYEIDLIANTDKVKTADSYNKTLQIEQEYKTNKTASKSAIDNAIRQGARQANDIVLDIHSHIGEGDLKNAVQDRVRRTQKLKTLTIIRQGKDKTYTRDEIIKEGWKL